MTRKKFLLKLKGRTCVFIDWANVHGWSSSLKREVDPKKIYGYLKTYKKIKEIRFYFGTDKNEKSRSFIFQAGKLGYSVATKPVKYLLEGTVGGQKIFRRKCDFDIEICMDVYKALDQSTKGFVFFTGDGDFAPLYEYLIKKGRQIIVVYAKDHIGREVWEIKKGLFKVQIHHLGL